VPDWPGELNFYQALIAQADSKNMDVLEIACGTGRIASRLAREGVNVTGLDLSPELLAIARAKSAGVQYIHWVQGDMRTFEIGGNFGLIIMPGHSFQFMLTPEDQVKCLENIKRHLLENGLLVIHLDHQDVRWLGDLLANKEDIVTTNRELAHPGSGQTIHRSQSWSYEPSTQTATVTLQWETLGADGNILEHWQLEPMPLHCVFRFEMEHLLKRVGFSIQAVYGDFFKNELNDKSSEMIWLVRSGSA
jgi:SAM-dependent methyltransferase